MLSAQTCSALWRERAPHRPDRGPVQSKDGKMGWVLFEVLLALGVAVFIVWWTIPKKKKSTNVRAAEKPADLTVRADSDPKGD